MRAIIISCIVVLFMTGTVIAQSDSVCVSNISELSELQDNQYERLSINFKIKKNFDYSMIPKGLKTLRFLKPSSNLVQAGVLLERIAEIQKIELNGRMVEFLPEILFGCNNLDTVILANSKLSQIWNYAPLIENTKLGLLVLRDFKVNEECKMYKAIFKGGCLYANKIFLETDKRVSANMQALLMDVFKTKELWINGKKQTVYVD